MLWRVCLQLGETLRACLAGCEALGRICVQLNALRHSRLCTDTWERRTEGMLQAWPPRRSAANRKEDRAQAPDMNSNCR